MMSAIIKKRRGAQILAALAITTVIAGWLLWVKNALGYPSVIEWVTSWYGLVLTIGGWRRRWPPTSASPGSATTSRSSSRSATRSPRRGGPPSPEQGARMAHLGAEIQKHSRIDIVLLFIAVIAMATARYW